MRESIKQLFNHNRATGNKGIFCVCSAHPDVVIASLRYAKSTQSLLSIETTAHQVNHEGGYTGILPHEYVNWVKQEAEKIGLKDVDYILGGDHLGPTSWKSLPATEAMEQSKRVVEAYVKSGYWKIHLDTSILCADDPQDIDEKILIERTTFLAQVAEETAKKYFGTSEHLFYIVGTEVPLPGGAQETEDNLRCTTYDQAKKTLETIKKSFLENHLECAWERVYGLVLQPGVEFGDDFVFIYKKGMAGELTSLLTEFPNIVYEAHSTDYQSSEALNALVKDHFAILKVGPWLTYAWREALFLLDTIEQEMPQFTKKSNIKNVLRSVMIRNNKYWKIYYTGTTEEITYKLEYSLSDRSRYYWEDKEIKESIANLLSNFDSLPNGVPYAMLSQYLPWVLDHQETKGVMLAAQEILYMAVERVLAKYDAACRKI